MAPRETENNAYGNFWGDKQRALWCVMVFLEWSISALVSQTSFCGDTVGGVAKCRLFSQATITFIISLLNQTNSRDGH